MPKVKKVNLPEFGKRMLTIRKELRLSQREMAKSLSITGGYISEIENGHASPGYEFYRVLLTTYPVNPDYLLLGEGEMFRGGSANSLPIQSAREIIEIGEIGTFDEMIVVFESSAIFRHSILGYASKLVSKNKSSFLDVLEAKEKIDKAKKAKIEKPPVKSKKQK